MACAQLSSDTADALEQDEGEPCEEAARGLEISASDVRRAQVFAISAKVDLADGDSAFLELTPDGLARVGRGLQAGGGRQALPVRGRGLMRVMFVLYLVLIVAGLVYFTSLGLLSL